MNALCKNSYLSKFIMDRCYLCCINESHPKLPLPHNIPVIIGRVPELRITDKECSRNQLELTSNCISKYVLVKRLGVNAAQIEGITWERNKTSKLLPKQTLYIVNMKYPHNIVFESQNPQENKKNKVKSARQEAQHQKEETVSTAKRTASKLDTKLHNKRTKQKVTAALQIDDNNPSAYSFDSDSEKDCQDKVTLSESHANNSAAVGKTTGLSNHWSQGLKSSMEDPSLQVYQDEQVVAIKDKYPKAKYHWLVLPKEHLATTSQLNSTHIPLIKHILKIGQNLAEEQSSKDTDLKFRCGYHAVASMSQLHMHVISQDFVSPSLKNRKHWNSFTTDYFVDAEKILSDLEDTGSVQNRRSLKSLLDAPLRCHRCKKAQKNMPTLKRHIGSCK